MGGGAGADLHGYVRVLLRLQQVLVGHGNLYLLMYGLHMHMTVMTLILWVTMGMDCTMLQ